MPEWADDDDQRQKMKTENEDFIRVQNKNIDNRLLNIFRPSMETEDSDLIS